MTTTQHVGILDYGAGNLKSLYNAFLHIDADVSLVQSLSQFDQISHLVLPGVGAFGFCQSRLRESGMEERVMKVLKSQSMPVLGICVGMQMLADGSEEFGSSLGLGICGGVLKKIPATAEKRVPHVGWNEVHFLDDFGDFSEGQSHDFYFDHSYALDQPANGMALGTTSHSVEFTSIVKDGLVVGSQFHPEKSQSNGLMFLKSFLDMQS